MPVSPLSAERSDLTLLADHIHSTQHVFGRSIQNLARPRGAPPPEIWGLRGGTVLYGRPGHFVMFLALVARVCSRVFALSGVGCAPSPQAHALPLLCYERVRRARLCAHGIARHSLEHGRTQKRPKRAQHWARNTAQHLNIHNTASDTGHVTLGT